MAHPKTAERILPAAYRRLAADGYARLNMRDIAAEAEVNHALIHYYFGTKDQLVIAVLDAANRRLIERQLQMYDTPGDFAAKWAQARAFYEEDLASGFVRVQMELWAASLSNEALRENFVPRFMEWRRVIEHAVRDALAHYQLDLPASPEVWNSIHRALFCYELSLRRDGHDGTNRPTTTHQTDRWPIATTRPVAR